MDRQIDTRSENACNDGGVQKCSTINGYRSCNLHFCQTVLVQPMYLGILQGQCRFLESVKTEHGLQNQTDHSDDAKNPECAQKSYQCRGGFAADRNAKVVHPICATRRRYSGDCLNSCVLVRARDGLKMEEVEKNGSVDGS